MDGQDVLADELRSSRGTTRERVDHHPGSSRIRFLRERGCESLSGDSRLSLVAEALKYGGPMDPPSTKILAVFAALVRSYAGDAQKPVWAGEFNTCIEPWGEATGEWLETAVTAVLRVG